MENSGQGKVPENEGAGLRFKTGIKRAYKRYVLDAMGAMGVGLLASLVIGLILSQLSKIPGLGFLAEYSKMVASTNPVVGATVGVAIAAALKVSNLAMLASAGAGALGYSMSGPVGAYFASVFAAEVGNLVTGKTKVDIIVVPVVTLVTGGLIATWFSPGINYVIAALQHFIEMATTFQPIPAGIVIAMIFGLTLTGPISSAGLAAMVFTVPEGQTPGLGLLLAAGAATVGCCCHMVGFAVSSYRDNGIGGLIAQGLGTSKIQMGNAFRRPIILVPPTLAAAILGPLSTTLFQMKNISASAGMGTSGLVGQFGTWAMMTGESPALLLTKILLMHFVLPAALSLAISEFMRKKNWIREGDMKLNL
jgi:uncharacterized membrane protein